MAKKKSHGGKRKGAGRKPTNPEGKTMLVAVTVPEVLVQRLDDIAQKNDWTRSKTVTEAIRLLEAVYRR